MSTYFSVYAVEYLAGSDLFEGLYLGLLRENSNHVLEEINFSDYERKPISFEHKGGGVLQSEFDIEFIPEYDWGEVKAVSFYTEATGGEEVAHANLENPTHIDPESKFLIPANELRIYIGLSS